MTAILAGLLVARPAIAVSPTIESNELNPPYGPLQPTDLEPNKKTRPNLVPNNNGRHSTRAGKTIPAYSGQSYSKEEVIQLIKDYSARYGISPDLPLAIARCESGYNQLSKNKSSSASGVFQYLNSTWNGTDEGRAGLSVFDADANIRAAIKYIASRGHASPWNESKDCWNG